MATDSAHIVGIDLGTTFSAIATLDDRGQAITLPNLDGEMLTPSAVLIDDGGAVIGEAARDVALEQPDRVALLVKRWMGHPRFAQPVAGRDFRPETLSALILRKLVQDAARRIGPVARAVITVPAYFDDTRRKATKDAGRIAGLDVIDILDEPTAAALAYSFQTQNAPQLQPGEPLPIPEQTVLVYDLGGGTFDVTLVRLGRHHFQSLAIEGDVRLGGKDWDDRVVEYVADKFQAAHGADPRDDPISHAALSAAAERAKRTLSKLQNAMITCSHAGKVLTVPLSRADFENLTRDLLTRTRLTTHEVLRHAGLTWDKVDRVLLVGGSTHMPMTRDMLRDLTGKEPDHSLAVSEVVARGAAIHAGIVTARQRSAELVSTDSDAMLDLLGDVVEINVNSHSLGIEVKRNGDRINDVLVAKNTKVLQGEATQADACIAIGECWIEGLSPALPKSAPIQVRCGVGSNGLVDVMALDMTSGKMARAELHRTIGLSDEDLAKEADWVRGLRIQ
jgi:molecular chaperone DnaK